VIRSPIFGLPNEDWFPARAARANEAAKAMSAATAPVPNVKSGEAKPHEPSMEEILASIRRIIADDQALPLTPRAAPSLRAVDSGRAPSEPPRRGLRPTIQPDNVDEDFKSSLAATVSDMKASSPSPEAGTVRPTIEIAPAAASQERENASRAAVPPAELSMPEPVIDEILPHAEVAEPADEPSRDGAFDNVSMQSAFAAMPSAIAAPLRGEALLSPSTDASVASSFNALATSMFIQNSGAIENAVRDMLRPMLQTWLDDNLPTMVERLVRAEIERVARGGRG
jgi:hypothetical protein